MNDYDKRKKDSKFQTANEVDPADFKEDPIAANWVSTIIRNLNLDKRQINRTNIKRELIDLARDQDNETNEDLFKRIIAECEKRSLKDLKKESSV